MEGDIFVRSPWVDEMFAPFDKTCSLQNDIIIEVTAAICLPLLCTFGPCAARPLMDPSAELAQTIKFEESSK
jgi:hypothetical protein